ncbi:acyltransferase family protein [Chitinimonas naiadis]
MNRLPGLDLLRAIAIGWVLLFHGLVMGLGTPSLEVSKRGWMGVDLFFVLSGFLIAGQLLSVYGRGEKPLLGDFYLRRALRILPAYLVVVLAYFFIPQWRETAEIQPLWQFLSFTENLFINVFNPKAFSHVWSLCVEEHFYLLFPLLAGWLMWRPSARKALGFCLLLIVGGMALRGYLWLHELAAIPADFEGPGNFGQRYHEVIYYPSYTRLDGLLAGVMLAMVKVFRPHAWARLMQRGNLLLALGVASMALSMWVLLHRFDLLPSVIGYPMLAFSLALIVAAACSPVSLIGRRRVPGAAVIATIAYSVYLSHKAVFHLSKDYLIPYVEGSGLLVFLVYALVALLAGATLYWLVERPFLRWRDRRVKQATAAEPPTALASA